MFLFGCHSCHQSYKAKVVGLQGIRLEQASRMEGWLLGRMWVLYVEILSGLWCPVRHTFPRITQSRSSCCTQGKSLVPLHDSYTLCKGGKSRPTSKRRSVASLSLGILLAIDCRWGYAWAMSGVWAISSLLSGIALHSITSASWCVC